MNLDLELYQSQLARWPTSGRHVLAQFDDESVIVYQAYRAEIGNFASSNGYFGGEFSLSRMSWIKTNFLWMMFRSEWGTKSSQEVILAVRIQRSAFDLILKSAIHSTFVPQVYSDRKAWQSAGKRSDVRLQFDPDHNPHGQKVERRAIQLGLRGEILKRYAKEWIIEIEDISAFVLEQRENVRGRCENLLLPRESEYPIEDEALRSHLGIADSL